MRYDVLIIGAGAAGFVAYDKSSLEANTENKKELVVEYYCLKTNEILVVFGEEEMNVVWMNKKTGRLENLKCKDFKEWVKSQNLEKELDIIVDSKAVNKR
jgi:predicted flavoprotein YhiN